MKKQASKKSLANKKSSPARNAFYAQSGGVTSVINSSACGVIETARKHKNKIAKVYAGRDGIIGALTENLIDTSKETAKNIARLKDTPAAAFGSCRYKLKSLEDNQAEYERLIEVFRAHDIGYFFYNGGNDSMDTANKVSQISKTLDYPITCVGIPKTIDNDLPITDNCPGFGSVAKYVATSIREATLDVASMSSTSTKVFIMEVMGRHAGWIAAAGALAQDKDNPSFGPQIILLPEASFDKANFVKKVQQSVKDYGFCSIVVSEGIKYKDGKFVAESENKDAFGHAQLGGVAPAIAQIIKDETNLKYHWAVCDYLQRSARHISSKTDIEQAYAVGKAAVEFAIKGENAVMPVIIRKPSKKYSWKIDKTALSSVANKEKKLPKNFISQDGMGVTSKCLDYLRPLIAGELPPPYKQGLPDYVALKNVAVKKKLNTDFSI